MDLRKTLLVAMEAAGIETHEQLADRSGIDRSLISRVLRGGRTGTKTMTTDNLLKLAKALNISLDSLFGLKPNGNPGKPARK